MLGVLALAAVTGFAGYEAYSYEKVKKAKEVTVPFEQSHNIQANQTPWGNYGYPTAIMGGTGIFDRNNLLPSGGAVNPAPWYTYNNPFPKGTKLYYRHTLPPTHTSARAVSHMDANTYPRLIGLI